MSLSFSSLYCLSLFLSVHRFNKYLSFLFYLSFGLSFSFSLLIFPSLYLLVFSHILLYYSLYHSVSLSLSLSLSLSFYRSLYIFSFFVFLFLVLSLSISFVFNVSSRSQSVRSFVRTDFLPLRMICFDDVVGTTDFYKLNRWSMVCLYLWPSPHQ